MAYSFTGRTIPAGRHAVLRVNESTLSGIVLSDKFGDEVQILGQDPTIIENISPSQRVKKQEGIFDLMGRRVKTPSKGVYIINGKKVCY